MNPHIPQKKITGRDIRRIILEQSKRTNVGHIGCALSVADIMAVLYGEILHLPGARDPERDRFVLSKGHAALALYAALYLKGLLTEEQLASFLADGSLLGVHPEHDLDQVDFSTGSLGQGLSYGVGAALAARLDNSSRRTFVLLSDGECNEGSVWEAAAFAAHHKLDSLTALIDLNGQQAFGFTGDVLAMPDMAGRWRTFGWHVEETDGHDPDALRRALDSAKDHPGRPHLIVAETVFGKGVSFMENQIRWHYLPMSDAEYQHAIEEVG